MRRIYIFSILSLLFVACGTKRNVSIQKSVHHQASELVQSSIDNTLQEVETTAADTVPELKNNSYVVSPQGTWDGDIQNVLDSLCRIDIFNTTQLGLYIYDITDDKVLYAKNEHQRMRPASCEKIITAVSALNTLGGDYSFNTKLRVTGTLRDSILSGDVYVIGGMDPLLSKKDVKEMAAALSKYGIDSISGGVYMDASAKDTDQYGWGWCWDDKWGPLVALTVDGKDKFLEVFSSEIKNVGIKCGSSLGCKECPSAYKTVTSFQHTIDEVLNPMMKMSENIYAESLFYQLAFHSGQKHAGRRQATKYIYSLIRSLGLTTSEYQIADGSGLSLYNYVSPYLLVEFLKYAYNKENIRTHFYSTLPVSGVDGTLKKRMTDSCAHGKVFAKTGTVDGISSLSGYALSSNGHTIAFSIINQGIIKTSTGKNFQDKVCEVLTR